MQNGTKTVQLFLTKCSVQSRIKTSRPVIRMDAQSQKRRRVISSWRFCQVKELLTDYSKHTFCLVVRLNHINLYLNFKFTSGGSFTCPSKAMIDVALDHNLHQQVKEPTRIGKILNFNSDFLWRTLRSPRGSVTLMLLS